MSQELELLRNNIFFKGLSDEVLQIFLDKAAGTRSLEKEEVLFVEEGDEDEIYFILEGEVRIEVELSTPEEQVEAVIFRKGDMPGVLAFIGVGERVATAIANKPAILLVWKTEDWKRICDKDPSVGYQLALRIAKESALFMRNWHIRMLNSVSWGLEG